MARSKPGSPYAIAWDKVRADVRSQNTDKSEDEILAIIGTVYRQFKDNWKTYKYTK